MSETIQERWARKGLIPKPLAPTSTAAPVTTGAVSDLGAFRERAWVQAKLDAKCAEISAMPPESGRNNALNAAAYSVGHYVPSFLGYQDAYDHLYTAAIECGCEGAAATLKSGLEAGMKEPRRPTLADDPLRADPVFGTAASTTSAAPPAADTVEPGADVDWQPPQGLRRDLPPFPTHVFGWLEPAVLGLSDELQTPVDLVSMMALTVTSATVRGRAQVRIGGSWAEPLNLYTLVIAGAGETKSPALARVSAPLRRLEAELADAAAVEIGKAEQARRIQEKRLKSAEDMAVKSNGDDRDLALALADAERRALDELEPAVRPRLLAGDMTAEALVRLLAEQGGALASLSAEGGLLDTIAGGRYSSGMANLDAILQAHDGREPIMVDRKGGEPLRVERPCLTLGLAVQPQVLRSIGENDAAKGRGFLARFLYSMPATRVGSREMGRLITPGTDVAAAFDRLVRGVDIACAASAEGGSADIADAPYRGNFTLSSLSLRNFLLYRESLEARLHRTTGDLVGVQEWANKLAGQTARLAGLLHLVSICNPYAASAVSAEGGSEDVQMVSDTAMSGAVALAGYFIEHAIAAHSLMRGDTGHATREADQLLGWVRKNGLAEFHARDAFNALRGRLDFREASTVQNAALELVGLGYLKQVRQEPTGGRPASPLYLVNPLDPEDT